MSSSKFTKSSQPEDDIDDFLYNGARKFSQESVIKWGPKDDMDNFLQQTVNCLDACRMAIKCTFSGMSLRSMKAKWDEIATSRGNNRSLNSNFIHTQECKIKAKSVESKDLTSQQFWMFHRVDRKEIYVVFSSQETSAYILSDADIWKMPRQKDIASVDDIPISLFKGLLQQDYNLVFTGHSLGGAIAILATYELLMKDLSNTQINQIRCITFGAPIVSYQNLGEMLKLNRIIFRYELPEDPVPQLLTAFQRVDNPYQEFLVNLMNLLGLQNSFKHESDVDFGFRDFLELSKFSVDEIKKSGKLGTVFVPQNKNIVFSNIHFTQHSMDHQQEWHCLKNFNEDGKKLILSEFLEKIRMEHQFERYEQQLFYCRLSKIDLPKEKRAKPGGMVHFRIPESNQWTYNPLNLNDHPNQVEAFFDEKFTKVIVRSKHPHVLGIRSGEIQEYPDWGIVASQILQDWDDYKIMFVFDSADNYKDMKKNSLIKINFCGCFETIQNIEVQARQFCGEDVSEIRSSAYENINLQQLYNSAFQACLFAGEGHNPMLQAQSQSENKRSALLQEDHNSLVELLGNLIVNQECLQIILEVNKAQFQTEWAKDKKFDTCDKKILKNIQVEENKEKLVDLAKKDLRAIYNKFKFDPKEQFQTPTSNEHQDAKDCVKESIPILFSLSCSLLWQMKMILWGDAFLSIDKGVRSAIESIDDMEGLYPTTKAAQVAYDVATGTATFTAGVIGTVALLTLGLTAFIGASIYSISRTGAAFKNFFKNSEEMQNQYKVQLVDLLKKLQYEVKGEHSVAVLEKEITKLCKGWLQQDEIGYNYNKSEKELNEKILEYTQKNNTEQEKTKEELKVLIDRKVDYLCKFFQNKFSNIEPRGLAALVVFIWNNYRIRFKLSKTLRIGVMGAKNAGKSTLCKLLGCAIERTGENSSTEDATLYQNVPTKDFCVVDFPHLDQSCTQANNTMKVFYSLSDIIIIVMKSQERADLQNQNKEACEIIKDIMTKYRQMGLENINRRFPVLVLFNQVDKMIFNEDGINDPDDDTLSQNFISQKKQIIDKYKSQHGIDEKKVYFLFASIKPQLPKPTKEQIQKWNKEKRNQEKKLDEDDEEGYNKLQEEFSQKKESADKKRLQQVTECSFFKWEQDYQENPQSIVSILAKMVQDLGVKQGADSIIDCFRTNNQ